MNQGHHHSLPRSAAGPVGSYSAQGVGSISRRYDHSAMWANRSTATPSYRSGADGANFYPQVPPQQARPEYPEPASAFSSPITHHLPTIAASHHRNMRMPMERFVSSPTASLAPQRPSSRDTKRADAPTQQRCRPVGSNHRNTMDPPSQPSSSFSHPSEVHHFHLLLSNFQLDSIRTEVFSPPYALRGAMENGEAVLSSSWAFPSHNSSGGRNECQTTWTQCSAGHLVTLTPAKGDAGGGGARAEEDMPYCQDAFRGRFFTAEVYSGGDNAIENGGLYVGRCDVPLGDLICSSAGITDHHYTVKSDSQTVGQLHFTATVRHIEERTVYLTGVTIQPNLLIGASTSDGLRDTWVREKECGDERRGLLFVELGTLPSQALLPLPPSPLTFSSPPDRLTANGAHWTRLPPVKSYIVKGAEGETGAECQQTPSDSPIMGRLLYSPQSSVLQQLSQVVCLGTFSVALPVAPGSRERASFPPSQGSVTFTAGSAERRGAFNVPIHLTEEGREWFTSKNCWIYGVIETTEGRRGSAYEDRGDAGQVALSSSPSLHFQQTPVDAITAEDGVAGPSFSSSSSTIAALQRVMDRQAGLIEQTESRLASVRARREVVLAQLAEHSRLTTVEESRAVQDYGLLEAQHRRCEEEYNRVMMQLSSAQKRNAELLTTHEASQAERRHTVARVEAEYTEAMNLRARLEALRDELQQHSGSVEHKHSGPSANIERAETQIEKSTQWLAAVESRIAEAEQKLRY